MSVAIETETEFLIETELKAPRHLKVSGHAPCLGLEPCEDPGCVVPWEAVASSCGRLACPVCGCSGTNLSTIQLSHIQGDERVTCSCGHAWVQQA